MKYFVFYIIASFLVYIVLLETTTRVFNLSGHTIPEINLNNNKLVSPNSEGIWIKGGMREIASHYKINRQGFNSIKDYDTLDSSKVKIAIIGDSYIESFHSDVENSIGRILEEETDNIVEVHEYGKSGGNIVDFSLLFNQSIKNKYDYTFLLISNEDFIPSFASFMGKGNSIPEKSFMREVYNHSSFMRYLNINHGLISKFENVFSFSNNSSKARNSMASIERNVSALKEFDTTCILLYEPVKLDSAFVAVSTLPCLEIIHKEKPSNHGFDEHWNFNGRKNCALTIKGYLEKK